MRGLLFLLTLGLLAVLAYAVGWINFSSNDAPGQSSVGVSVNKDEVRRDVDSADESLGRVADRTKEGLSDIGRKLKGVTESEKTTLKVSRYAIALDAGTRSDITVTRTGTNVEPFQLAFVTSPGSNLIVTGGKFDKGQRDTIVTIEAPAGAVDGRVDISHGEAKESVTVEVKTLPATMWEQSPAWPQRRPTVRL